MNSDIVITMITMTVLVATSAYFSATETAFSSLNRVRLKAMADKGNKKAERTLELSEKYDRLLSTLLIGNNIVNIAMASISTAMFVKYYGDVGATISTCVVTVVVLIFGEISPKSLAKDSPESFAMLSTPIIKTLIVLMTPINYFFTMWQKLLSKIFKVKGDRKMTADELLVFVDEVEHDGVIDKDSSELLRSAIEFNDREAEDILTHRVDLEAVSINASKDEIAKVFSQSRYSRMLVYEDNIDNIVGVIHQKDFYEGTGTADKEIKEIMTTPLFITKSTKISDLLKLLQKSKAHIAVVSDEYGGTLGIVTMEDILEELVGEIWDEHDEVTEDFHEIDKNTYRVSCATDLEKMYRFFGLDDDTECSTVGGWVMEHLGRIPNEGDSFTFDDLNITVTKTDYRRVLEIEVKKPAL